ncbi:MAG: carboxypeptidase-like regulatory domain-containing protein [Acidobacteriota bacterium]
MSRVLVSGPTQVAPGGTASFTAIATYTDGSTQDVTLSANWSAFPAGVVRLTNPGQFDVLTAGETRIQASFRGTSSGLPLLALAAGTFKLSGTVRDASGVVEAVVVEARFGGGSKSFTTSRDGKYAFYGVAGAVELLASARGYDPADMTFSVSENTVRDVSLTTTATPLNLAGSWTLSLSASSPCSDSWPETIRHREEPTDITENGTRLTFKFTSPTFQPAFAGISGRIAGSEFSMAIDFDDYYLDYGLLERPSPTDWVGVFGTGEGTGDQSTISGTFNGRFDYYITQASARFLTGVPKSCAANPEFTLRRQ